MPGLESKYEALRKLFPGWVGKDAEIGSGGGNTAPVYIKPASIARMYGYVSMCEATVEAGGDAESEA
ncbi:hypothetical protein ANO11243_046100 [Dothideomycetidae sp. 11243]|nr:hypothetical protein ANO11243_046100 [fungal sp. No.11243]